MRILICAQQAPLPPVNGFRLQLQALVSELRRAHEVRVLALRFPDQQHIEVPGDDIRLVPLSRTLLRRGIAQGIAATRGRSFGLFELAELMVLPLEEELDRFRPDIVHVAGTHLASLGRGLRHHVALIAPLDAAYLNADARAMTSAGIRRWLLRMEVARVRRFEAAEYRHFRRLVVVSDADAAALTALEPSLRPVVIPNGVDAATFAPTPGSRPDANKIIFAGVMQAAPNISAAIFLAHVVMPRVRASVPGAYLSIVGRAPIRGVRRLAKLEGVEVVGQVADMRMWLATSQVAACPMISGTGIKNKVLEAMACGVPCVATPLALHGLQVVPGRDLLVGATASELASHIVTVLRDDNTARMLGDAGRAYVVSQHTWRSVGEAHLRLYESLVADSARKGYRSESQVCSERPPSTGIRAPVM